MRDLIPAGWPTVRLSLALLVFVSTSCSLKAIAVNTLADVLAESEVVYLSDEDPELVAEALPFNLKTIETLLASSPDHRGLLLSATTGFTFYAYGFVEPEADRIEDEDLEFAEEIRDRAARLYWRAYRYGIRGLEVKHPGLGNTLSAEPESTVAPLEPEDVPLALWTAAALGGAIGVSKDDPEATADIAVVGALLERCLDLDPNYGEGILYELLVIYESQRFGGSRRRLASTTAVRWSFPARPAPPHGCCGRRTSPFRTRTLSSSKTYSTRSWRSMSISIRRIDS